MTLVSPTSKNIRVCPRATTLSLPVGPLPILYTLSTHSPPSLGRLLSRSSLSAAQNFWSQSLNKVSFWELITRKSG
ncbi:hypothetical protein PanWU01x14_267550 [Parasponia andersonii]|uniref:Uncharacterized protein n=1 Tax=Parasponia andersonii TaxID=3476 RepID=A0A2P5B6I1_PARAD|nr:hypothetical protein PanWU01x14_267550 [Parasponia andersonii]